MDNFRHINNTLCYIFGNSCIKKVTEILALQLREDEFLAKIGGEHFGLLLIYETEEDITKRLELLLREIRKPFYREKETLFLTVSMGISFYSGNGEDFARMMQNAELAMFYRKENGKDGYSFYEPWMYEKTMQYIHMTTQIREAIKNDEFFLCYQPEYDLITGEISALEVLIRWNHPSKGMITPSEFIPFSEESGHIVEISEWVMKTALYQKRKWEEKGLPTVKIAVNLSGYVVTDERIIDDMCDMLREMGLREHELEIEVTETAVMMEMEKAINNLEKFRRMGISIAMDDFGTGYSSLTYLRQLSIDTLKLDRDFLKDIKRRDEINSIYKTVIELAHALGMKVVAEGIENEEQKEFLVLNNCDIGQGFYLLKPVPADEIEKYLI
jgi:diguanylate cyclase (GGDEF)-like protein